MQASSLTFCDAELDDVAKILQIIRAGAAIKNQHGVLGANDQDTISTFEALSQSPLHRLIALKLHTTVIGTMHIAYLPDLAGKSSWRAQFEAVHILAEHRGKGYGSQLLNWAIGQATDFGAGTIQLTSNKKRKDAHGFYENLGFSNSHEGFKLMISSNN